MIHLFNRAVLLVTSDLERLNQVREALMDAEIECQYRTQNLRNPAFFSETRRVQTESFGIRGKGQVEYKLYVHKAELDRAKTFL